MHHPERRELIGGLFFNESSTPGLTACSTEVFREGREVGQGRNDKKEVGSV